MSEEQSTYSANPGKQLVRTVDGVDYQRIPVKTHLITNTDDMADVVVRYAKDRMQEGDILFISEKAVACTQNRAIPMEDIKPRKLAVTLSRYVTKTPAGIGLGIPETMEMALRECGTLRILFAAFCSVIGKLFRRKGWFYIVAGPKARGIDGPTEGTIPPYDHYVVLTPAAPCPSARYSSSAQANSTAHNSKNGSQRFSVHALSGVSVPFSVTASAKNDRRGASARSGPPSTPSTSAALTGNRLNSR